MMMMRRMMVLSLAIGMLVLPGTIALAQPGPAGFGAPPPQAAVEEPKSLDDALVIITAGDISGFIDTLGPVTAKAQPTLTAETLKTMLGMKLRDQQLQGLPKGAGGAVVVFPPGRAVGFIEVAPSQIDTYMSTLQTQGAQATKASGLLVVTQSPQHLALGTQFAPEVAAKLLAGAGVPTIKVFVNMPKVLPVIEPGARGFLDMIEAFQPQAAQQGPGAAATNQGPGNSQMRILRAEILGLLDAAKQMKSLTIEAQIAGENIQTVTSLEATAGSPLATLFAAPTPSTRALSQVLPAKGTLRGTLAINNDAAITFLRGIFDTIGKEIELTADEKTAGDTYLEMIDLYSGGFAFDMFIPGQQILSGSFIYGVKDEEKTLDAYANMNKTMSTFLKIYEEMGMPMKMNFMKNVRAHRGTQIHKFAMDMTMPEEMPKEVKDLMKIITENLTYDMAFKNKMLLAATGGVSIEELIDAVENGSHPAARDMNSRKVFGSGAKMYTDIDVSGLTKFVGGIVKQFRAQAAGAQPGTDPVERFVQIFSGLEPIAMAGFWGNGPEAKVALSIPSDFVAKAAAGVAAAVQIVAANRPKTGPAANRPMPTTVEGKVAYAKSDLRTIATGLEAYFVDNNKYPASLTELTTPIAYLTEVPVDPFSPNQSTYKYAQEGKTYRIWSIGPDAHDNGGQKEYDAFNNNDKTGDIIRAKK